MKKAIYRPLRIKYFLLWKINLKWISTFYIYIYHSHRRAWALTFTPSFTALKGISFFYAFNVWDLQPKWWLNKLFNMRCWKYVYTMLLHVLLHIFISLPLALQLYIFFIWKIKKMVVATTGCCSELTIWK